MRQYQPGGNIFETSSDQRFNSFSDPSALAYNQRNGSWGVDPNFLTPAYTAAYRPQQNINQGNPMGGPQPSFGQSFNQVFNPFASGGTNYGGNTMQQQSPYYDTLGYNPLDHGMNFAQKWAVPGFSSWLSYKYLSKPLGNLGDRMASGASSGIIRGFGASGAISAGGEATLGAIAGGVGRLGGSFLGPMAVAQAVSWAADKAVFDPYIAQRQTTNDLRRNFSGITFGGDVGDTLTGKGFSREQAGRQATQIGQIGAKDYSFSMKDVSQLTDLSARSGLLDNVQGNQISERMKAITKQVKTVMQIGNTSDFKEAIEILSKLQSSGVGAKDVSSVVSKLGGMASVAGVSLQKMMSTVGSQGEYMFASNGLNPYGGQLTAANAYGAFSAAQRTGLMSTALLARMGGVEGATQSATGALLGMAQTPYAGMSAYNKYVQGGSAKDVVGNVSRFSGAMAKGGLSAMGTFEYTRAQAASRSLEEDGQRGQMQQLLEIAHNTPGSMVNGQVDAGAAFKILQQRMGLTEPQARAFIESQRIVQDPKARAQIKAGIVSAENESRIKWLETEGYGSVFSVVTRPLQVAMNESQASVARSIGHGEEIVDSMTDSLATVMNSKLVNANKRLNKMDTKVTQSNLDALSKATGIKLDFSNDNSAVIDSVSDAYKDPDVKKALEKGDLEALKSAISQVDSVPNSVKDNPKKILAVANLLLQKKKSMPNPGPAGPDDQQLTGTTSKEAATKVMDLAEKVSRQTGKLKEGDLDNINTLTKNKFKAGDERKAISVLSTLAARVGSRSMDISGDADNFMSNAERLIGYRSHKKQNEQIDEGGAAGAPSLNFDSLNNAMDAIAQTIDPNSKTMRVSIEKDNTSSTLGSFFGHDAFKEGIERNYINTETRSNK
jgi:hypothetical protein